MEAPYWLSNGTFIELYPMGVSKLNEDGSRGIFAVVADQQQLSAD